MGDLEVRPWPALRGGQRLPELGWQAVGRRGDRRRVRSFLNATKQKRNEAFSNWFRIQDEIHWRGRKFLCDALHSNESYADSIALGVEIARPVCHHLGSEHGC